YRGMSFAFSALDDAFDEGDDFDDEDGEPNGKRCMIRTVNDADLYECSIVSTPAYESSRVSARNVVDPSVEKRAAEFLRSHFIGSDEDMRRRVKALSLEVNL